MFFLDILVNPAQKTRRIAGTHHPNPDRPSSTPFVGIRPTQMRRLTLTGSGGMHINLPQVLDRQAFIKAITSLPSSIFRVKGLIELSAPRQTALLQYVAGRWDITPFPDPQAEDRFLTFIGKTEGPDPLEAVEALLRAAEA